MAKLKQSATVVKKSTPAKTIVKATKVVVQPKPKVTVGRLKQVVDSLKKEVSFDKKQSTKLYRQAKYNLIPNSQQSNEANSQSKVYTQRVINNSKKADRYNSIISKASEKK